MSKYQITLTPIDKFFFGGDMTFQVGKNEKDEFNERYSSYIIKSLLFPQQTTLLGMLRFLILRNAGDGIFKEGKIVDKAKAKTLIGDRSFMVNDNHDANDFGVIKNLTHVRIGEMKNSQLTVLEFKPLYEKDILLGDSSLGTFNFKDVRIPELDGYKAKEPLVAYLTDEKKLDDHYVEDRRIGIARDIKTGLTQKALDEDDSTEDKEKALYIQVSYRFRKDAHYCFVFEVEVDDSFPLERYSGQMVLLGGDNSQFIIGISKEIQINSPRTMPKAVCILSPTFLNRDEATTAAFAITNLTPFRFLESEMDKAKTYHILNKELKRSSKYELYAPGSVFYFENEEKKKEFIKMIESKKEFRQIGYNEYQ